MFCPECWQREFRSKKIGAIPDGLSMFTGLESRYSLRKGKVCGIVLTRGDLDRLGEDCESAVRELEGFQRDGDERVVMVAPRRMIRRLSVGVAVIAAALFVSSVAAAESGYVVRDLGTFDNRTCSPPYPVGCAVQDGAGVTAFNNTGQVAGWTLYNGNNNDHFGFAATVGQPFTLMVGGALVGPIGWEQFPNAINDSGAAVGGTLVQYTFGLAPFLYSGGVLRNLGYLCSPDCGLLEQGGTATDINESNQVVGWARADPPALCPTSNRLCYPKHAFLWQNGAMTDLGTLAGETESEANGVTNTGVVVGDSGGHGVMWIEGAIQDFGVGMKLSVTTADTVLITSAAGQSVWSDGMVTPLELNGVDTVLDINTWGQTLGLQGSDLVFHSAGTTRKIGDLPLTTSRPLLDPVLRINNLAQFAGAVEPTLPRYNTTSRTNAAILTDTAKPTCTVLRPQKPTGKTLSIEVQDAGSGLLSISADATDTKTRTSVPNITAGTLQPATVTIKGPPTKLGAIVHLRDIAGNTETCKVGTAA